jgi:hypothetical protein
MRAVYGMDGTRAFPRPPATPPTIAPTGPSLGLEMGVGVGVTGGGQGTVWCRFGRSTAEREAEVRPAGVSDDGGGSGYQPSGAVARQRRKGFNPNSFARSRKRRDAQPSGGRGAPIPPREPQGSCPLLLGG